MDGSFPFGFPIEATKQEVPAGPRQATPGSRCKFGRRNGMTQLARLGHLLFQELISSASTGMRQICLFRTQSELNVSPNSMGNSAHIPLIYSQ